MIGLSPAPAEMGPVGAVGDAGPIGSQMIAFGAASVANVTTRVYYWPYTVGFNSTTTINEIEIKVAGYLANLFFRVDANSADTDTVVTVYVNGAATALTVTVPAGSTATISDTTHHVTVAPGDKVAISTVRAAGTFGLTFGRARAVFERVAT